MSDEHPISQWIGAVKDGVAPCAEQGLWEEYLEGYTNAEIAEQINRSIKTVEWRLKQIRKHLAAVMVSDEDLG